MKIESGQPQVFSRIQLSQEIRNGTVEVVSSEAKGQKLELQNPQALNDVRTQSSTQAIVVELEK